MADSAIVPADQVRSFRQLMVWEEAVQLSVLVHKTAAALPPDHRFELGREMRRSSISVPSNVAEGFNRHSRRAYRSHIAIALGSDAELETQLEIARRLDMIGDATVADVFHRCALVGRLLQGLWRSLK